MSQKKGDWLQNTGDGARQEDSQATSRSQFGRQKSRSALRAFRRAGIVRDAMQSSEQRGEEIQESSGGSGSSGRPSRDGSPPIPHVFLANRGSDGALARELATRLMEKDVGVWFDGWEIVGGDNFVQKMDQGLLECRGALLLLSDRSLEGSWTEQEYHAMLARSVEPENRVARSASDGGGPRPKPFVIPIRAGDVDVRVVRDAQLRCSLRSLAD